MTAEFTLGIHESQSTDAAAGDFLDLRASATCRGYSGETSFPLSRRDLDVFLADLDGVRHGRADSALLLGGWGAVERMRLQLAPAGLTGEFVGRVKLANNGPREDLWHRVETEFVCSPDALSAFVADLHMLMDRRARGSATLIGDPDAIA